MSKVSLPFCGLLPLAAVLFATPVSAQLLNYTTSSSQQGWYSDAGEFGVNLNDAINPAFNYRVGEYEFQTYRDYFVFDRSGLTSALIKKATLDIFLPSADIGPSYYSGDPADVGALFSLYKFSGSLSALKNGSDPFGTYAALAPAGALFGSVSVSEATNSGLLLSIELSSFFLDYLNGISGEFALAGSLSNANASPVSDELMFLNSEFTQMPQLRLQFVAVPEPSTYGLIGAGVLGLLVWRRRAVKAVRKN